MLTESQYDILYEAADKLFKRFNPCKIRDGYCERIRNVGCYRGDSIGELCCHGCQYHDVVDGCNTKSLGCKLWICAYLQNTNKSFASKIEKLYKLSIKFGFIAITIRQSKEDYFKWKWLRR
jgi:hypothetical protein